jgi:hypothetical protein
MLRFAGTVAVLVSMLACTTVKVVQRDGCWVKRTEHTIGGSSEELGFCTRQPTAPAEDRLARLVQECMAQADHRWENQALDAWNRNQPLPAQADDTDLVKTCMSQATAALGLEAENSALKSRIADLSQDRQSLRTAAEHDHQFLQGTNDKMIGALGEAAKKPLPAATATATATMKSETDTQAQPPPTTVVGFAQPAATPVVVLPAPAAQTVSACPQRKPGAKKLVTDREKDPAACGDALAAQAPVPR